MATMMIVAGNNSAGKTTLTALYLVVGLSWHGRHRGWLLIGRGAAL
jgi:AAA15 family ATPase/GTPase